MATRQAKLPSVNKQIIEIKKRIQLAEGQRKALFDEIEVERKRSTDEISTLRKDITKLVATLNDAKTDSLKVLVPLSRLRSAVGSIKDKSYGEMVQVLDLQVIDKNKKVDLLNYMIKKKEDRLTKFGKQYQEVLIRKSVKSATARNEKLSRIIIEKKNKINAFEVKWREAEHIKHRYNVIKRSLLDDSAQFESKMNQIGTELLGQMEEINRLKKINKEAGKLKAAARNSLLQAEKQVVAAGNVRQKQAEEGKVLVQERKQDLEKLERQLYQGAKPQIRAEEEEDLQSPTEPKSPSPSSDPMSAYTKIFATLQEATGGSSMKDVLNKFESQKETQKRLGELRESSENIKNRLEVTQEKYLAEYERLKFMETKDAEQNAEQLEILTAQIVEQKNLKVQIRLKIESTDDIINRISDKLQSIYISFNRDRFENDPFVILKNLHNVVGAAVKREKDEANLEHQMSTLEISEEKWLPLPYNDILRRTPLPKDGSSPTLAVAPVAAASDDEEEVPSRTFLKRQAQLVVDAKMKRKSMRFQVPKLK